MNANQMLLDAIAGMRQLAQFERDLGLGKQKTYGGDKKKTQPGATHKVNPVFKPRQIYAMPPSMFRRMHKGVVKIVPNYLKPSPAPRWRNRYEPQLDR